MARLIAAAFNFVRGRTSTLARRAGATGGVAAAALAFGALAVFGVRGHVAEQVAAERERLAPHQALAQVVVARTDLPAGAVIGPDTMAVRALPLDGLPGSAVRPDGFDAVAGATLVASLRAGEPLIASAVSSADPGAFASRVRAGVRAITIAVDEVNALSGMLQPGDRIDLLLSARPPARPGAEGGADVTVPLMQDVTVLATGRRFRPAVDAAAGDAPRSYTTITIEAEPVQAQRLIVAQRSGRLTAILRNPDDHGAMSRDPMDLARLLDAAAPPRAAPRAGAEVIVGGRGLIDRRLESSASMPVAGATSPLALPAIVSEAAR